MLLFLFYFIIQKNMLCDKRAYVSSLETPGVMLSEVSKALRPSAIRAMSKRAHQVYDYTSIPHLGVGHCRMCCQAAQVKMPPLIPWGAQTGPNPTVSNSPQSHRPFHLVLPGWVAWPDLMNERDVWSQHWTKQKKQLMGWTLNSRSSWWAGELRQALVPTPA